MEEAVREKDGRAGYREKEIRRPEDQKNQNKLVQLRNSTGAGSEKGCQTRTQGEKTQRTCLSEREK